MSWEAANARARGLATHLLDRAALLAATEAGSWRASVRALIAQGYPARDDGASATPVEFDRSVSRILAERLRLLERWLGRRRSALAVCYEEAESRALRRLLRGSAQGASPTARLRGITPTPELPARSLEALARAESPARLTELLIRLGHPAGRALQAAQRDAPGGQLALRESALARLFALRATRAARNGGRAVRRFAALLIDLENVAALLLRDEWGGEASPAVRFVPGGLLLDRARFSAMAALDIVRIRAGLAEHFVGTPLAGLVPDGANETSFEARGLLVLVSWLRHEARRNPLGPAVVLEVIERMRAEAHDVRLVTGAAELSAPRAVVEAGLATAA